MALTQEMKEAGITPILTRTTRRIRCPKCGKEFSLFQSRAIACRGCRLSAHGCQLARCIRCDYEFPLEGVFAKDKEDEKILANYINNIVAKHNRNMGRKDSH